MSLFLISQIIVVIAVIVDIASFQFKHRSNILTCLAISCFLISIHFMCLEHWTGAWLFMLNAIRYTVTIFTTARLLLWVFLFFCGAIFCTTYAGLLSVLSFIAAILTTVASFSSTDKRLRELIFCGTCFWIVHNILAGSPGAVALESCFMISNVIGYYRYYHRPQPVNSPA